jgi:hypothetical protein
LIKTAQKIIDQNTFKHEVQINQSEIIRERVKRKMQFLTEIGFFTIFSNFKRTWGHFKANQSMFMNKQKKSKVV